MAAKFQLKHQRWWGLTGAALAAQVCAICNSADVLNETRRARYANCLSDYEGRRIQLDANGFYVEDGIIEQAENRPLYNLTRSACDTVKADIAGRQKPKPMFVTTGGNWRAKRKAKKQDKFVEGQLSQRQGRYANTWELMLDVFHDTPKLGFGAAKVTPDIEHKKVMVERVFPWELHVDAREARYGSPQNLFHIYTMEMDIAIELFVELDENGDPIDDENADKLRAIETARRPLVDQTRVIDSIFIREAWRLPFSDKNPGKHVICVDNAVLFEEDWTDPEFPFVMLWWEKETIGMWGQGIAEAHAPQQALTNRAAKDTAKRMRICSTKRTYVPEGGAKMDDMEKGGGAELLIPVQSKDLIPVETPSMPVAPVELEFIQFNRDMFYALSGVSQSQASAQKEPGVDAAIAMQTLNDIATVRFLPKARAYEESFVTLGRLMVRAAKRIAKGEGGYLVRWPGKRFLQQLNWNDVSLEEDEYDTRVAPISMYSRDPAAMLQLAQQFFETGIINRETFLQMTQIPDLEGMMSRETAEREYLEELFDRYLDAKDDAELKELGGYEAPEPFMIGKAQAMWLAVSTYWEAKRDRAPIYNLDLLERWITQLDKLIASAQPPPQPTMAVPGALPVAQPRTAGMAPGAHHAAAGPMPGQAA